MNVDHEKKMLKIDNEEYGIVKSPLTKLSEKDHGDETQRRFRYQHTVTSYFSLLMYCDKIPYKEILCEHHEDIIGVLENGYFQGIQVKTRQLSDGPFKLSDEAVFSSLCRFIENSKRFTGCFKKFIFASNCDYIRNNSGDSIKQLMIALREIKEPNYIFKPGTLDKYISKLEKETDSTRLEVIEVLRITEFQTMPGLDDIESKIIKEVLSKITVCSNYTVERLESILDKIIYTVYLASSKKTNDPIEDYVSLLNGDKMVNIIASQVNSKRITKDMLENIIKSFISKKYYLASSDEEISLNPHRKKLMEVKMNCGMIDPDAIEMIDDLRDEAEEYFLKNYHRESADISVKNNFLHIRKLVKNQAIEAKIETKSTQKAYGSKMLTNIEKRLYKISNKRATDVDNCPYEILKGMVGILTGECEVQFSDTPEGGWKVE